MAADRALRRLQQPNGLVVPDGPSRDSHCIGQIADRHLTNTFLLHETALDDDVTSGSSAVRGSLDSGSDGTRTRELRRDRPTQ